MTEAPSKTSNHQRLKEMMVHLTPKGALIPYNVCIDPSGCIWVASKGGLFKFDSEGKEALFELKNNFPKKMAPYCQVLLHKDNIVFVQCEDKEDVTEFRILDLDGKVQHESFIEGKIQGLTICPSGIVYMTKQCPRGADEFFIYKTEIDVPLGWEEFASADDFCFQSICALDSNTIAAAICSVPTNMYSKQNIVYIDASTGSIKNKFSTEGKEDGQVYFPRSLQAYQDGLLVLDKTGRIQHFDRDGKLLAEAARIDSYIGNGFVVRGDEAVIACSGMVEAEDGETICDDWVESIKLDGSFWTENKDLFRHYQPYLRQFIYSSKQPRRYQSHTFSDRAFYGAFLPEKTTFCTGKPIFTLSVTSPRENVYSQQVAVSCIHKSIKNKLIHGTY